MTNQLEQEIAHYQTWRDQLISAIGAYQDWLERAGRLDAQQSLRIYDLVEGLKRDHLVLAFVAEFSRGKTELVNALFFSDFKQRLLPSDAGRTTMCPTEIFYNPSEPPYIRLLPIETRYRDESINTLKRMPIEWSTISLNLESPDEMITAMKSLAEVKTVFTVEARTMGLWDDDDATMKETLKDGNRVEIPAWRYAMINYPHPLLKSGLVILDTPGLNALGTEPELTLSTIPAAHGILFLLATDTGVTKSDIEIWHKFVKKSDNHRVAVLNKIDILWDELKTPEQIQATVQRQLENTARQLNLPISNVIALSAQKALVAKIRGDADLLEKSGIAALERMLAVDIIPSKQEIVRAAITREIGTMVETSRKSVHNQLIATQRELVELNSLSGKNREVTVKMREKIIADKIVYDDTVKNFNATRGVVSMQGKTLLSHLSVERIEQIVDKTQEEILDSWTTAGLTRGMQSLFRQMMREFEKTLKLSVQVKRLLDNAYLKFHERHYFEKLTPPDLDLNRHRAMLLDLVQKTEDFCRDPINLMTEKRFLIRKFYMALVTQAQKVFEQARKDSEVWLRNSLDPLLIQVREYKTQLERRLENIKKIHDNIETLQERIKSLSNEQDSLQQQSKLIDEIIANLDLTVEEPEKQAAQS